MPTLTEFLKAAGKDYCYAPAGVNLLLKKNDLLEGEPRNWRLGQELKELGCVEEWREDCKSPALRYSPEGIERVLELIRLHPDDLSPKHKKK